MNTPDSIEKLNADEFAVLIAQALEESKAKAPIIRIEVVAEVIVLTLSNGQIFEIEVKCASTSQVSAIMDRE